MKILVTVGTTAFDELTRFVDTSSFFKNHQVTIQYGPGKYIPVNHTAFSFDENIENYYNLSDIVITHGGAGSLYKLLDLQIPVCAVPNLERIDDHQLDICKILSKRGHILYAEKPSSLCTCIQQLINNNTKLIPFRKEKFFCATEIANFLLNP